MPRPEEFRITSDFKGLDQLVKALSDRHAVRIGIMGGKSSRRGSAKKNNLINNAEIGAIHEFGSFTRGIPKRSWLRMPLHQKSEKIIAEAAEVLPTLVTTGSNVDVLKVVGIAAENAIQDAFGSGGFGTWKKLSPATVARKGTSAILIASAQLRRSVASKVVQP